MSKHLGRFFTQDSPMPMRGYTQDGSAQKKLVATFAGSHHVAERNAEGDLEIFSITDDLGMPAHESRTTTDTNVRHNGLPTTSAEISRQNEQFWRKTA